MKKHHHHNKNPRKPENIKNRGWNHEKLFLWFWGKRMHIPFGEWKILHWIILGITSAIEVAPLHEIPQNSGV